MGAATDGGTLHPDGGPRDTGRPMVRRLVTRPFIGSRDLRNLVLAPDLDLQMFNLGWVASGAQSGAVPMTRYIDARIPAARPEWVEVPDRSTAPPAVILFGVGKAPDIPLRAEAWVNQTVTATAPGEGFDLTVYGLDGDGVERALELAPMNEGVVFEGRRWTHYEGVAGQRWYGFVTIILYNGASTRLGLSSPLLEAAPQASGTAWRPGRRRLTSSKDRQILGRAWRRARGVAPLHVGNPLPARLR